MSVGRRQTRLGSDLCDRLTARTDQMYIFPLRSLSMFQRRRLVCDVDGSTQYTPRRLLRLFHPQVRILQVFLFCQLT